MSVRPFAILVVCMPLLAVPSDAAAALPPDSAETGAATALALQQMREFSELLSRYGPRAGERFTGALEKGEADRILSAGAKAGPETKNLLSELAAMSSPERAHQACLRRIAANDQSSEKALAAMQKLLEKTDSGSRAKLRAERDRLRLLREENDVLANVVVLIAESHLPHVTRNVQLEKAAMAGDLAGMEKLVAEGADVRFQNRFGYGALHGAAAKGQGPAVEWLLAKGADANGGRYNRPLHLAVRSGAAEAVKSLIAGNAELGAGNGLTLDRLTLLGLATAFKQLNVVSLRLMKELTAERRRVKEGAGGLTPLHYGAYEGKLEIARMLLEAGADPNLKDPSGLTPLHLAAWGGHRDLAELLLARGAAVNAAAEHVLDYTPLAIALSQDRRDVAALLLEKGADVHARTRLGTTALHLAAARDSVEMARALLARGASPDGEDALGESPLTIAETRRSAAMKELLAR